MNTIMQCDECESRLFEFHEGSLDEDTAARIDRHLQACGTCSDLLADIWQMKQLATRWQDEELPGRVLPSPDHHRWSLPDLVATAASILALVLVLSDARLESGDRGIALRFGGAQTEVNAWRLQQEALADEIKQLRQRQVASDQLVLRSVLEASREERREEMRTLLTYWNEQQDEQFRETEQSLRYLLASQAEDERDIRQLSDAVSLQLHRSGRM